MAGLDLHYLSELIVQAADGDSNAFAEFYVATYPNQYAFAMDYLKNDFHAKEAILNAYSRALSDILKLRDSALCVVWLNQIVLRACMELKEDDPTADPESREFEINGERFSVRQTLRLPLSEAQVILLHFYLGMKPRAVADLLELTNSDVRKFIKSGHSRLHWLGGHLPKGGVKA